MENLIKKWNSLNGAQKRAFGDSWITHDTNLDAWNKDFEDLSNLKKERVLASIGDIEPKDLNHVVGSGIAGKIKELKRAATVSKEDLQKVLPKNSLTKF